MNTAAVPATRRTPVLVIVLLGYLMIVLDISIVITAIPKMQEVIIHLAFYAGWPRAMSAIGVAKRVLES
jgi:hypothetical protein